MQVSLEGRSVLFSSQPMKCSYVILAHFKSLLVVGWCHSTVLTGTWWLWKKPSFYHPIDPENSVL